MKINKNLNLVELASEMAEVMLHNVAQQSGIEEKEIIEDFGEDEFSGYTEEAQDLFNEYYDEIWEYLENKGFKHVNS